MLPGLSPGEVRGDGFRSFRSEPEEYTGMAQTDTPPEEEVNMAVVVMPVTPPVTVTGMVTVGIMAPVVASVPGPVLPAVVVSVTLLAFPAGIMTVVTSGANLPSLVTVLVVAVPGFIPLVDFHLRLVSETGRFGRGILYERRGRGYEQGQCEDGDDIPCFHGLPPGFGLRFWFRLPSFEYRLRQAT